MGGLYSAVMTLFALRSGAPAGSKTLDDVIDANNMAFVFLVLVRVASGGASGPRLSGP